MRMCEENRINYCGHRVGKNDDTKCSTSFTKSQIQFFRKEDMVMKILGDVEEIGIREETISNRTKLREAVRNFGRFSGGR